MILQPEAKRAAARPIYKTKWVSVTTDVALIKSIKAGKTGEEVSAKVARR